MSNWYSEIYRRNLVDMHINDWSPEFLSKFSLEDYFENLKRAHIQAPMIYFQSHAGHCYFPTKVGHMHSALIGHEDMIKRLTELCHNGGMKVVGYYSLIYNTYEEEHHPEWRLITGEDGTSIHQQGSRYGLCCPNNPEYREFVLTQIKEMADYFTVDGMFYDMTFWPGICRCPYCMEQYRKAGLSEIPKRDFSNPDWMKLMRIRIESIGDFAKFVTDATHRFMPGVSVEHNYAHGVAADSIEIGSSELVNDQCDYTGGDLYGDLYNHSFTAKYYLDVSKNQPFEYMTCRCDPSLSAHTVSKTTERLATEVMLTASHHGASFIIDAIDPIGTLDKRVYDRIGKVFEYQIPYEKYFTGELRTDVGVWYSVTGRYNPHGQNFTSKTCSVGAVRALIKNHIPVGVISNSTISNASKHKMIVAGGIAGISDSNRHDIAEYVNNGGILYISGANDPELLKILLNAEIEGYTDEGFVYLVPTENGNALFGEFTSDYPIPTELSLPKLKFIDDEFTTLAVMKLPYTKTYERRFASIHSNPPGILTDIPALIVKKYGKGQVVWSAAPIENDSRLSHNKLFCNIILSMITPSISSTAPRQVELTSFDTNEGIQICAVDLLCTDELLPIRKFTINVKCQKPVRVIKVDGYNETETPFSYSDGYLSFDVDNLIMFGMYRIITQ
jgi:hypothetical protein